MSKLIYRILVYCSGLIMGIILVIIINRHREAATRIDPKEEKMILQKLQKNPLYIGERALCRMNCRNVSKDMVIRVLNTGKINIEKSDQGKEPCDEFLIEGIVDSGRHLSIIFGGCDHETIVLNVFDQDKNFDCKCL